MQKARKSVICLEASWFPDKSVTVQPYLETLRTLEGIPFLRYPCDSMADLSHYLSKPVKGTGILYIAMHGQRGKLSFDNVTYDSVALPELADMLERRYAAWHIHLSSCETLNVNDHAFETFKKSTKAGLVSGYTKQVDWIEGYALDMLMILKAQKFQRNKSFVNFMYRNYPDLINRTGLYIG